MKRSATSKNYGGKHEPLIRASRTVSSPADRSATAAAIAPRPTKWGEGGRRPGEGRAMIHSMTRFGRASGALSDRFFVAITTKSVNHRFLEVSVRLPEFFWELEPAVRAIASETFSRGKVDISVRVTRTQQPEYNVRINAQIANTIV